MDASSNIPTTTFHLSPPTLCYILTSQVMGKIIGDYYSEERTHDLLLSLKRESNQCEHKTTAWFTK